VDYVAGVLDGVPEDARQLARAIRTASPAMRRLTGEDALAWELRETGRLYVAWPSPGE
jgi:hypothetical protein